MERQHAKLIAAMVEYDHGDARRIHHFLKVHSFAATLGKLEGLDEETLFILETAAILHDIGIHVCEAKYGMCDGKHQEMEGPAEARKLMAEVGGYTEAQTERVCWLIAHHHTYKDVEGMDYQLLLEADFLVNCYEDDLSAAACETFKQKVFRSQWGIKLLEDMLK